MSLELRKFSELTINFDKERIPLSSSERETKKGKYPYYGAQGIIDSLDEYIFDGEYLLIAEDGENLNSRSQPIANVVSGKFWVNNHAHIVKTNSECDIHYLCYLLNNTNISGYITGSAQPKLNQYNLNNMVLEIQDYETQCKISKILKGINNKIKLNEEINKNLHLLSKNIFKYYMEDFCPFLENGMQNSELGNIPIDWKVHDFNSIADIFNGYSYKGNELQPSNSAMATIKNFNRDGSFRSDGFKEIVYSEKIKEQHFVNENDVLVSCTDVTQDADIIGNCVLLLDKQGYNEVIMSMDLVKVESKIPEINNFLLAAILKSYRFKMHILGYVNGTTVLHLDKKGIKKFRLALPSDLSILKDLSNIMEQIYNQISINMKEINNLTKLRDTLLPKLMSGEIDVSKINCDLE